LYILVGIFVSSNQRAIRLAISGLLIILGLMSLSQAGYFVIRYFTLGSVLDSNELYHMMLGFWRGYWLTAIAVLIHFNLRELFESRGISLFLMISVGLTGYSFFNFN
jgi:hypothetical protein